jgi:hypothetical protein
MMKRLLSGKWTAGDRDYGEGWIFGANRYVLAGTAIFAVVVLFGAVIYAVLAAGGATGENAPTFGTAALLAAVDLAAWFFLVYEWTIQLRIGEFGFKYVTFTSVDMPLTVPWRQVRRIEAAYPSGRRGRIVISLFEPIGDTRAVELATYMTFSAGLEEICAVMTDRLAASRE